MYVNVKLKQFVLKGLKAKNKTKFNKDTTALKAHKIEVKSQLRDFVDFVKIQCMEVEQLEITSIRKLSDLFERKLEKRCNEIIVKENIAEEYFTATEIMFISEVSDKKSAAQIAKDLCVTKALVSITAKKLITRGYLERDTSITDRRACIFSFTQKGEEIKNVVERVKEEFKKAADKLVTTDGVKVINKIVEILLKKLGG